MNKIKSGLYISSLLISISAVLSFGSCKKYDRCGECFSPAETCKLRLVDKIDSTDLLYSGVYSSDSISIYYYYNDKKIQVDFEILIDSLSQAVIISSNHIAWESVDGHKDFYLELNYVETDTLFLNVESKTENCCTYHPYLDFTINGNEPDQNIDAGYYYYFK